MRLPPFVYGYNGSGFAAAAIAIAKKNGYAAYVGMLLALLFPSPLFPLSSLLLKVSCRRWITQALSSARGRCSQCIRECTHKRQGWTRVNTPPPPLSLFLLLLLPLLPPALPLFYSRLSSPNLTSLCRYHAVSENECTYKELAEAIGKLV